MRVLAVNAGSTSAKITLLDGEMLITSYASLDEAIDAAPDVDAVAHRVVHGGRRTGPVVVNDDVLAELEALTELAPLHQPPALQALRRCRQEFPDVSQVACFDTAFHTTIPPSARTYALPARLRELVEVYGFHGLSYAWSAIRIADLAPDARRVVVAHLGGGESLCGLLDGRSVVTTMGFTPLDGLVMAKRSGSLDPGALLWLSEHTDEDLAVVLENESGLLGLCGTGDMREVLQRAGGGDEVAEAALQVYLHRLATSLGACVAALEGLDALVFTGGIGENSAVLRQRVAQRLRWLGVAVDPDASGEEVTGAGAAVRSFVIHAREDIQMVRETSRALRS